MSESLAEKVIGIDTEMAGSAPHFTARVMRLSSGEDLPTPSKAHPGDAGFDLRAAIPDDHIWVVGPGQTIVVPTGFVWAIEQGWCGMVCPRSGLAAKHRITVGNGPGIVDASYRGEVKVILHNESDRVFEFVRGERIAQLVLVPVAMGALGVVDTLSETDRGENGFGSSGIK